MRQDIEYFGNKSHDQRVRRDEVSRVQGCVQLRDFVKNRKSVSLSYEYESVSDPESIWLIENMYTRVRLVNCKVNIFALKQLIKWNLSSLRQIEINHCTFFLSDKDANENINKVANSRMLEEIDFVYYIQSFQFFDIEEIDIHLIKESNEHKFSFSNPSQPILVRDKKQPIIFRDSLLTPTIPEFKTPLPLLTQNQDSTHPNSLVMTKQQLMQSQLHYLTISLPCDELRMFNPNQNENTIIY